MNPQIEFIHQLASTCAHAIIYSHFYFEMIQHAENFASQYWLFSLISVDRAQTKHPI